MVGAGDDAMTSVLTIWCTTRQCEVLTGITIDAEALIDLAQHTDSLRCTICGREHALKDAYLKPAPAPATAFTPTPAVQVPQRRADAH
jgi:hypothetical protein